jgi:hypothetical protein
MIIFYDNITYMIATKLAVFMTAMVIAVGISVAPLIIPEVFAATNLNSSKSNIYAIIVPQEGEVSCINQAEGQGDKAALANTDQTAQAGEEGDPIPDIGVDQSKEGEFTQGDPEITVNAEQSNECGQELSQTVDLAAEGPVSGTIETTE